MPAKIELRQEEKDKIIELYKGGVSFNELYRKYGYCNTVVRRTLVENGIRVRGRTELRRKKVESYPKIATQNNKKTIIPVNCDKIGMSCLHKVNLGSTLHVCDYIGHTGKMRGCEPTECTKYAPRRGNGKTKNQS